MSRSFLRAFARREHATMVHRSAGALRAETPEGKREIRAAGSSSRSGSGGSVINMVDVNGLSISVSDTGNPGPAIVLCHGNSCSKRSYQHQLESPLSRRFRLIAFDWPGHGDSSRAIDADTTYTLPGYAGVLVELTRNMGLSNAIYIGWSLGGHVLLEASDALPDPRGFAIFGTPPLAVPLAMDKAFLPNPAAAVAFRAESTEHEIDALCRSLIRPGSPAPPSFIEDFRRTDKRVRASLAASIERNDCKDELQAIARLSRPIAILHGEHDQFVSRHYFDGLTIPTLWRGSIQEIANVGHAPQWEDPATFNALIEAFARDCSPPTGP